MFDFRDKRGFASATELLIVLAIIGIASTMSWAMYYNYMSRYKVRHAVRAVLTLKRGVNDMAKVCKGMPYRSDLTDQLEFITMIDRYECDWSKDQNANQPIVYPSLKKCDGSPLGDLIGVSAPGESSGVRNNGLCKPPAELGAAGGDDSNFMNRYNFNKAFIAVPGHECNQVITSPGGGGLGWNYNLLTTSADPRRKAVGVICATTTTNYKRVVKIVVNTSGSYGNAFGTGNVPDGSGVYDIDGAALNPPCPCGPWCQETRGGDVLSGCCSKCDDTSVHLGYRY